MSGHENTIRINLQARRRWPLAFHFLTGGHYLRPPDNNISIIPHIRYSRKLEVVSQHAHRKQGQMYRTRKPHGPEQRTSYCKGSSLKWTIGIMCLKKETLLTHSIMHRSYRLSVRAPLTSPSSSIKSSFLNICQEVSHSMARKLHKRLDDYCQMHDS